MVVRSGRWLPSSVYSPDRSLDGLEAVAASLSRVPGDLSLVIVLAAHYGF